MKQDDVDKLVSGASGADGGKAQVVQAQNISFLHDVTLQCVVEFGRTSVTVKDILKWKAGIIIELNKEKGVALDISANNNPIGRGEAVVVNDKFGIRVTEVISPNGTLEDL